MSEVSNTPSDDRKSRKRKFKQQYQGQNKRRKLNNDGKKPEKYDIGQLTKSRNIILCSCQKYKEKRCGRDLQSAFSRYIQQYLKENNIDNDKTNDDKTNDDKKKDQDEDKDEDIDDEENEDIDLKMKNKEKKNNIINIADEINKELSSFDNNKLCEWYEAPSGLTAIEIFHKKVAASKLLQFIFDKHHPKKPDDLSPFVFKMVPMDLTSFAKCEDMINLGKQMIQREKFNEISKDDSYGINYKNRGNKQLDRDQIIKGIANHVSNEYKVNLKQPKTVILLQTFGKVAGLSIIKDGVFAKHKEYNMSNFKE